MTSLMAIRRSRNWKLVSSTSSLSVFKVRSILHSDFSFNRTLILSKTLSSSSAVPDNYQRPLPSSYQDERNLNSQWNQGKSNQWGSRQGHNNQWDSQGQNSPQYPNRNQVNTNQWNSTDQNPNQMNPNQWNSSSQNFPQHQRQQNHNQWNSSAYNFPQHQQQQNHNQWNSRPQNYPQYQNHQTTTQVDPNVQDHRQSRIPNQWNNQNLGYPQARNPDQWARDGQNPNQGQGQGQGQGRGALETPAPVVNAYESIHVPAPSIVDLMRLCQEGKIKEALEILDKGVKADANCFYHLFELCVKHEDAKKVHDYFLQSTLRGDLKLNNKVIEMYGKCASMTDARRVFDHMPERNMDSWHLMINGYASNNLGDEGLQLFEEMRKLGLKPTEQTFLAVLSACASAEAVEEGFLHFESMKNEYGINPGAEHYLGVIDILGKSGYVNEIEEYIQRLPFEPTAEIWGAWRNYARIHGDVDIEDRAEELMVALEPSKAVGNKIPTPLP
ncbi:hypothetical protein JCGZ_13742 [Jatropha curcas]|uniref:Pentacotripeptide-repeat region of PRORP domain-containing protein n=1 Tax=Jatropha curcas TaxID=180498 RepID=A0A067KG44_JATCU|nr:hypothetical protein JCGZ_13742 [Jatropha curcas]